MNTFTTAFLGTLLALASQAQAHHVWIEQDASGTGNATFYFGEFGDNLRETSPGRLDRFAKPVGEHITATGASPLVIRKSPTGFSLPARAAPGESLIAYEPGFPVSERKEGDATVRALYAPAARLVNGYNRQQPKLTLDLVPTGNHNRESLEVQVFFQGKPLPKARVDIVTTAGWGHEHRADDEGKLRVALPWRGIYVLEVKYAAGAGERGGEKYDRANYVTSLTLTQPEGLAPLPAAPSATPSKTP